MPAEESVQNDSCSCYFGGRGLPDVGLSVRGRGCGALRKVRRTLAGIPLFGGVWSLSHFVADPGRSFRAVVSAVGDWVVLPALPLFLTVGRLPPGCPGCRGRSDVGVIFACRRCSGAARGVSGIGRETAEIIRAGRYSASFRGFSQRILPFSGKICIFVSIAGKCGPVFASLLNPRADEDFAGFGLIIKKKQRYVDNEVQRTAGADCR